MKPVPTVLLSALAEAWRNLSPAFDRLQAGGPLAKSVIYLRATEQSIRAHLREVGASLRLSLYVIPNSRHEGLESDHSEKLVMRVCAQPMDGKANRRVLELLARQLGVPKRGLHLARGETSRYKEVQIDDIALKDCLHRLGVPTSL